MANRGISTSAITSSMETEVITTTRIREPTSPRVWLRVSEAASRRWVSPIRRETAMPSSEARVMMPRPPIQIPTRITAWPKPDQYVPVGTVVRPVMHTADVAVKNASAKVAWWPSAVAWGLESNAVNTVTMPAKAVRVSRAGECRATSSIRSRATSSGRGTSIRTSRSTGQPVTLWHSAQASRVGRSPRDVRLWRGDLGGRRRRRGPRDGRRGRAATVQPMSPRRRARPRVVWSPALLDYDFRPRHPMAPLRLDLTFRLARELGVLDLPGVDVVGAEPAGDEMLVTAHDAGYVAAVRRASETGQIDLEHGLGTDDDPVFPGMHEAAARQVTGSVSSALEVWRGEARHAVNLAGGMHHAMADHASGCCVYNDAVAAIRAVLADGAERIAYVDLDAHHGDGVERAFWDEPRVMTISVHESGHTLFPGIGHPTDVGGPHARGSVVNVPLEAGTADAGWLRAVGSVVLPMLRAFRPQVVVSQHGCDAHGLDPIANLAVSVDAQRAAEGDPPTSGHLVRGVVHGHHGGALGVDGHRQVGDRVEAVRVAAVLAHHHLRPERTQHGQDDGAHRP